MSDDPMPPAETDQAGDPSDETLDETPHKGQPYGPRRGPERYASTPLPDPLTEELGMRQRRALERMGAPALAPERTGGSAPFVHFDPSMPRAHNGAPRESPQAAYAYSLYAALSPSMRSYQRVLDMLVMEGKLRPTSIDLIERWGRKWNWPERAKVADAMRVEQRRLEWEEERVNFHLKTSEVTGAAFERVAAFLEDRLAQGRMGTDAAVQLLKIAADLRHRAYQELLDRRQAERGNTGIQIVIETDRDAPAGPPAAKSTAVYQLHPGEGAGLPEDFTEAVVRDVTEQTTDDGVDEATDEEDRDGSEDPQDADRSPF